VDRVPVRAAGIAVARGDARREERDWRETLARRARLVIPDRVGADPNDLLREAPEVAA